jgi:hypothetical protein
VLFRQVGGAAKIRVHDISNGGLALVLKRRFERGTGLALQLPGDDPDQLSTVLVRVVHIRAQPGGLWRLGCAFVSTLSDEELAALLGLAQQPAPVAADDVFAEQGALTDVHCRLALPDGRIVHWHIRRLWRASAWPPAPGAHLALRIGGTPPGTPALPVTIQACRLEAGGWALECVSTDPGAAVLLASCCAPA